MTLAERLLDANQRASRIYLQRQQLETDRQRLNAMAQQLDVALMRTDGEVELLTALMAEAKAIDA